MLLFFNNNYLLKFSSITIFTKIETKNIKLRLKFEITNKRDKILKDNSYIPTTLSCPELEDRKSGHLKSIVKKHNRFSKSNLTPINNHNMTTYDLICFYDL
jgi:hypothetical protein